MNLLQIRENKSLQTRQVDTKELTAQNEHIKTLESTIKAYDNRVAELVQTIASMKEENERLRNEKEDIITEKDLLKLVIIGWDFLKSSQAVVDCGRLEISLEDCTDEAKLQNSWRLSAIKDYVIPAQSMSRIAVVVPEMKENGTAIVEDNKISLLCKEVFIPNTVTTIKSCNGVIWIANGRAEPQTIPKVMCIGFAEPLMKVV